MALHQIKPPANSKFLVLRDLYSLLIYVQNCCYLLPHAAHTVMAMQVEERSVADIAAELSSMQQLAAANKLQPEHLNHGTITISNIGSIGGNYATPMIFPPQLAIVALGKVRPVAAPAAVAESTGTAALPASQGGDTRPGAVDFHSLMGISWGADHRVVDGATLAKFSNHWKALLEQPSKLLLRCR